MTLTDQLKDEVKKALRAGDKPTLAQAITASWLEQFQGMSETIKTNKLHKVE